MREGWHRAMQGAWGRTGVPGGREIIHIVDIMGIMSSTSARWLSTGGLSAELVEYGIHLSPASLQRYAREGTLPAKVTPGGHYRFDLSDVLPALGIDAQAPQGRHSASPLEQLIDQHREEIRAVVARHHGRATYVFGSVARGETRPDSDIDFLVDFEPGSSLFDVLRITDELEQMLGCRVDVVATGGLKPRDHHIRREAIPV